MDWAVAVAYTPQGRQELWAATTDGACYLPPRVHLTNIRWRGVTLYLNCLDQSAAHRPRRWADQKQQAQALDDTTIQF
jgi:hypothetical protein